MSNEFINICFQNCSFNFNGCNYNRGFGYDGDTAFSLGLKSIIRDEKLANSNFNTLLANIIW